MSKILRVTIKPNVTEINLDGYFDEGEELEFDDLYDGFIHEIKSQPEYEWEVVVK